MKELSSKGYMIATIHISAQLGMYKLLACFIRTARIDLRFVRLCRLTRSYGMFHLTWLPDLVANVKGELCWNASCVLNVLASMECGSVVKIESPSLLVMD